jgi:hypothetical protein
MFIKMEIIIKVRIFLIPVSDNTIDLFAKHEIRSTNRAEGELSEAKSEIQNPNRGEAELSEAKSKARTEPKASSAKLNSKS